MNKYRSVGLEPEGLVKESYLEQLGGGTYKLFTPVHIQYYSPTVVLRSGSCGNITFEARASTCKVELSTAKRAGSIHVCPDKPCVLHIQTVNNGYRRSTRHRTFRTNDKSKSVTCAGSSSTGSRLREEQWERTQPSTPVLLAGYFANHITYHAFMHHKVKGHLYTNPNCQ